ncbi:lysine-specific histone demethylase 1 homolog 1-like [Nicotiana tabacum]|uniref:lysine-specific histone demethylase 1 homolog 1-like n=1 Tax=Nicotiana tabacum TaxID=4097 RepID=UPI003F4E52D3
METSAGHPPETPPHINSGEIFRQDNPQNDNDNSSPPQTTPEPAVSDYQPDDLPEPSEQEIPPSELPPPPTGNTPPQVKKRRRRKRFFTDMIPTSVSAAAVSGLRVLRPNPKPSTAYSYSETELATGDDLNKNQNRRRRISDLAKEVDLEALIAISVGFPVDSLTEEEIEANVVSEIGGVEQSNYIVVRNHILARWRSNVTVWLTKDHALESIRAEHKNLVHSAYTFLLQHGYINYGVAPAIKELKFKTPEGVPKGNVIVIGAGLSGLVAARQLISLGFKVVVLEGRGRPGGRVRSKKMSGGQNGVVAAADLGGSVLTGINGNPLGVLARQLGIPLHKVRDICPLYLPNGRTVNSDIDSKVEASFNKLLDRVCKLRQAMLDEVKSVDVSLGTALETFRHVYRVAEDPQEQMLLDWHLANLEYANASLMSNLSMAFWDQDDPYEMGGDHCFIPGGNERLIRALAEDIPIFYDRTVESVRYGTDGVLVYAGGQEYRGDMVLCTVPLGVLKRGNIEFVPDLPQRKKDAIERLGFGLLNKVAILFPYDFWGGEIDTFGHLNEDPNMRGEFFLFYSYSSVSGGPLLIALVAGEAAVKFEKMSPLESVGRVLEILKGIFSPKGIAVPDPLQAVCTRWGQDQFCCGSYSYVAIGASGDDYDILSESVGDRLFFAGEATNKQYPATMHGAFLSGMREAAHILRVADRKSISPAEKSNNFSQENIIVVDKFFETPDLKFGSFSVLYDPISTDLESNCLVRVALQGEKLLYLYSLIARRLVLELSKLEGDMSRIQMLTRDFGVKLVGWKNLSTAAGSLITSIESARSV